MKALYFITYIIEIYTTHLTLEVSDQNEIARNPKRKIDDATLESSNKKSIDLLCYEKLSLDKNDELEIFINDNLNGLYRSNSESKDMTIINEHDDFKIKSIENEIIQSVNEYMRYNEIEFLKELSKDKPKFTKECIDNMIYILENSTLTYSLNFFKKVPLYFDNHLIKYFLIKEDIEYEEVRYSNILASLMLLLYKVNPIEISSVTTIVNKEVKNVTDSYIQTTPNIYLDQIVRLFYKNFIPLSKKLNKDLKYLKCNCENFVLENDSYKDLSMNIIEEIIHF